MFPHRSAISILLFLSHPSTDNNQQLPDGTAQTDSPHLECRKSGAKEGFPERINPRCLDVLSSNDAVEYVP